MLSTSCCNKEESELSDAVSQQDIVWGLPGVTGENNAPWLRLRTEETSNNHTRHIFTLERSVTGQLDSIEHETEIKDPVELASIIHELGFTLYADTTKNRQKTKVGEIEICLDNVKGLGKFIEAEKLTKEDEDYEAVVAELWELLGAWGITRESEVTEWLRYAHA